jgi:ABC-type lipoprotein export system ATPase subunit
VIEAFEKAKSEMNSTILMVTHDSFSASFCDRVILLKDGVIYKELKRTGGQSSFQGYLLDTLKEMSNAE